jgi:polysaccharide biosynthesis/export protein
MLKTAMKKLLALSFLLVACGSTGPYVWASSLPPAAETADTLRAGDRVQVVVHGQDAMSGEFEVRPGGDIVLPVAGRVNAAGTTPEQLSSAVRERLRGVLADPLVTVVVAVRRPMGVSVIGEVRTPGRYEMRDGETMVDALARAGGLTPFADADKVFLVRRSQPGPRIRFRYSDFAEGSPSSIRFQLKDGDVVVVE